MTNSELMAVASASEQGIFKSKWIETPSPYGPKKKKVISDELNDPSAFWIKWCGEMVNKTIIRRALKRVKEVLPELTESIYAFEQDEYVPAEPVSDPPVIEIPMETENVDIHKLTAQQQADCKEVFELFKANPKLAEDKVKEIKQMFDNGLTAQEVINKEYAGIAALRKSKSKWAEIGGYFVEKGQS
jgi:hypothetical protein